jgi:hypothetical protein
MLHAFLRELDESQRSVFVLAELEGHSAKEIARALAIKPNTASSRLRLARQAFCVHFGLEPSRRGVHEATRAMREQPEQPDAAVQNQSWGLLLAAVGKPGSVATGGGLLSMASAKFAAMFGGATMATALMVVAVQAQPQADRPSVSRPEGRQSAAVPGERDMPLLAAIPNEEPTPEPPVVVQAPHPPPRAELPSPADQLRLARSALVAGDPRRALAQLDLVDPEDARLLGPRVATRVAALCKLGEVERAQLVVDQLRAGDPNAPVLAQLDGACW